MRHSFNLTLIRAASRLANGDLKDAFEAFGFPLFTYRNLDYNEVRRLDSLFQGKLLVKVSRLFDFKQ